ncbi:hypothetical protein GDO78_002516 [Eleutherodactylus coqui]|uniref:FAM234A/B beta-propeller domain-containing protein n=1 Tax=Eleutherodactylus coqui TaxID=57060 RepID=A0A8J6K152_ELECQ|nr:hypothetical protein GDO78_002516 [Eleutherodactylus coqui]
MSNKDVNGEDNPLNNNEGRAAENNNDASGEKDVCIKKHSGLSRLSKIRTAAFFISLFLCLTVVFAFSFIIPCPERPISEKTWSVQHNNSGHTLWEKPTGFPAESAVIQPVLKISDVDKDGVEDIMVFLFVENELQSAIFSGQNGEHIGQRWRIGTEQPSGYYTHVTKSKAQYVLFYKGGSIVAYSVSELSSHTAGPEAKQLSTVQDSDWEAHRNITAECISLIAPSSSGKILYILNVPGRYYNNILVVKSEVSELLDGQKFETLWTVNTTNILSKPALGYFNKDVFSIMMEVETDGNKKKVFIVDSRSGAIQWEIELNLGIARQNPAVLNTGDHRSTFLFWGMHPPDSNNSELEENLFMFHPVQPNALLQLNNHTENIILFTAALFERSRHSCYILITGPNTTEDPGTLTISKRKLKEAIGIGKILWFGTEEVNTEKIRDDYFRIRYSSH